MSPAASLPHHSLISTANVGSSHASGFLGVFITLNLIHGHRSIPPSLFSSTDNHATLSSQCLVCFMWAPMCGPRRLLLPSVLVRTVYQSMVVKSGDFTRL